MKAAPPTRRKFLETIGAAAALSPFVPVLQREAEAALTPRRRFIVFYTSNGTYAPAWHPRGSETSFDLQGSLAPLARHKRDLLIFKGVHMLEHGNHMAHPGGPTLLTNWAWPHPTLAGGVSSIDQLIAERTSAQTRYPSLGFMVYRVINTHDGINYRRGQYLRPEDDPRRAFERLFGEAGTSRSCDFETAAQKNARRRSVLDHVSADLARLRSELVSSERVAVEAHLESVRAVERSLLSATPRGCVAPAAMPANLDRHAHENLATSGKAFIDLMVAALACDMTRVATLMWHRVASKMKYPWLGAPHDAINHHDISHGAGAEKSLCAAIDGWHAGQFAYLLDRLKAVPEGNGTLADNTMVMWASECGAWTRSQHDLKDIPYVLAGGGWALKTGRFMQYDAQPIGKLLTSVAHAFDVPVDHVGSTRHGSGPLVGLT